MLRSNAAREYETKRARARDVPMSRRLCEPVGDTLGYIEKIYFSNLSQYFTLSLISFIFHRTGRKRLCVLAAANTSHGERCNS